MTDFHTVLIHLIITVSSMYAFFCMATYAGNQLPSHPYVRAFGDAFWPDFASEDAHRCQFLAGLGDTMNDRHPGLAARASHTHVFASLGENPDSSYNIEHRRRFVHVEDAVVVVGFQFGKKLHRLVLHLEDLCG